MEDNTKLRSFIIRVQNRKEYTRLEGIICRPIQIHCEHMLPQWLLKMLQNNRVAIYILKFGWSGAGGYRLADGRSMSKRAPLGCLWRQGNGARVQHRRMRDVALGRTLVLVSSFLKIDAVVLFLPAWQQHWRLLFPNNRRSYHNSLPSCLEYLWMSQDSVYSILN